jgi:glutamate racemase
MQGGAVADADIAAEIAPAFVEADGKRTDMIVLACTHYPFLLPQFTRLAPWHVEWIDPAPAIAARVVTVAAGKGSARTGSGRAVLTSGREWSAALLPRLGKLGLPAGPREPSGAPV